MKLKLYKARKLEKEIGILLREETRNSRVNIRFKDKDTVISKLNEAEKTELAVVRSRQEKIKLQFEIRKLIEEANFKSGISGLMNEREVVQELLKEIKDNIASTHPVRPSEEKIYDDFDVNLKVLETPDRYANTEATLSFFTKETYDAFVAEQRELKKLLENINEKLASLNLSKEITLTDEQETFLKEAKLI